MIYTAKKLTPNSNTVVDELNAKVLTATFKNKSGVQFADLYTYEEGRPKEIVARDTCAPVGAKYVETIQIQFNLPTHTPEPWRVEQPDSKKSEVVIGNNGQYVAYMMYFRPSETDKANAERIVACVNALAGISDPEAWVNRSRELVKSENALRERVVDLQTQCNEQFQALKCVYDQYEEFERMIDGEALIMFNKVKAVISKIKNCEDQIHS